MRVLDLLRNRAMSTVIQLSDQELAALQQYTACEDPSDAAALAVREYLRMRDRESPGMCTEEFLERAGRLDQHGQIDAALDLIYDSFDALFRQGAMLEADRQLAALDPSSLSADLLIGVLTATLPARSRLPSRAAAFDDIVRELKSRGQLSAGLLTGLEP